MTKHQRLIEILLERSVRRGTFTLASGATSDLYVDARQTTLSAEGAHLVAHLMLARLKPEVVGVGGPVTGADPIAGAIAAMSWQNNRPIHGFMVRKQTKSHGTQRWVEGRANLPDGSAVCMVEDTVTTGGSLLDAIKRVQDVGLNVVQCLVVVDRQEGAAEKLASAGITLDALVTRRDLVK